MDAESLDKEVKKGGSEEGWKGRPDDDVLNIEMKESKQDDNGFLLDPGEHKVQGQVVNADLKQVSKSERCLDGRIRVIALSNVEETWDLGTMDETHAVSDSGETELATAESENDCCVRQLQSNLLVEVTFGVEVIAATDDVDLL